MTRIALARGVSTGEVVNLFDNHAPRRAFALRTSEQRERMAELAQRLSEMLDKLDVELKIDRERAIALLAEYSGLLEIAVEDISRIREIDETFGAKGRQTPRVATLATKLEKGLAYLLGIFSVVSAGENLSPYNWKLIERDVQNVLGVSRSICDETRPVMLKEAA
jgi:hypothetical protein